MELTMRGSMPQFLTKHRHGILPFLRATNLYKCDGWRAKTNTPRKVEIIKWRIELLGGCSSGYTKA